MLNFVNARWARCAGLIVMGLIVVGGARLLMFGGVYGIALFVAIPMILGALAECFRKSASAGGAAMAGALTVLVANIALLVVAWEGVICIAMSLPLTVALGALGASFVHAAGESTGRGETTAFLLLLPLSAGTVGFDLTAKPPVFEVTTSVDITATPEQVWKHMVSFPEMAAPEEWYFKTGIAYPERVSIEGAGVGAARSCEFSTGPFAEKITIWDEPRLLQFTTTESPAPMREWSPYGNIEPKHLHGYFLSKQGQFRLTPLANGHTLLEGTSWYQHGLWPSQYWRLWTDAIVHRVHTRVLTHIRALAEADEVARR